MFLYVNVSFCKFLLIFGDFSALDSASMSGCMFYDADLCRCLNC